MATQTKPAEQQSVETLKEFFVVDEQFDPFEEAATEKDACDTFNDFFIVEETLKN